MTNSSPKIFIIGLPRTGTTSLCITLLELGYRVAHTAYTPACLSQAEAIADTPIFCDYKQLDRDYPHAKFIYLTRELSLWLPSICQLLNRMHKNLTRLDGGFNPTLKRCYKEIFTPLTLEAINDHRHLTQCYQNHQSEVKHYFQTRPNDLLTIDISHPESYAALTQFLNKNVKEQLFPKVNVGGKVTYWKKIKHPLKVDSLLK